MKSSVVLGLILCLPLVLGYTDESINLLVRSKSASVIRRYCIELARLPNNRTIDIKNFGWHSPYLLSPAVSVCNMSNWKEILTKSLLPNITIIVHEDSCRITEHAWNIESYFGPNVSLMIITNRTNTHYELTYNTMIMPVTIPVLVFWENDFIKLNNAFNNLSDIDLTIDLPLQMQKKFRPAVLLMFFLVLIILLSGNLWAADEFKSKIVRQEVDMSHQLTNAQTPPSSTNEGTRYKLCCKTHSTAAPCPTSDDAEPAILPMTYCVIIFIISFAVGWLLLLYYFPKVMIRILQVIFCIGAFSSLMSCLNRFSYFVPSLRCFSTSSCIFRKPCAFQLGPLNMFTLFSMMVSLTLVIVWYVYRQAEWAWVLQDILGASICITVISMYRLGNLRAITIILIAFFLYDIFFVFITPHISIFQNSSKSMESNHDKATTSPIAESSSNYVISRKPVRNPSVMEQVALGIGTNGEVVPLLLALPMFVPDNEIDPCATVQKSMLGFGDIILPGIVLTFCKIFDISSNNRWPVYYVQSVISYFLGLSLTHVALYLMNTAQPALLYLVPCLLLSTIITGLCRRELKELYTGERIQSLLKTATANRATSSSSPSLNDTHGPKRQPKNEDLPQNDIVVDIHEKTTVD